MNSDFFNRLANVGYLETEDGEEYGTGNIRVPNPGEEGPARVYLLPCTANVTLAAAATGTLTFTPNRNIVVRRVVLGVFTAAAITRAATYPEAISITTITVMGRPQIAGTGNIPLSLFLPDVTNMANPIWENCQSGQSILFSLTNNDAATTHVVTGALWVTTVK